MIIFLLFNVALFTISIWYLKNSVDRDLIGNVIILEIASTVFNLLFGLFLLFDFMESHPTEVGKNLLADSAAMIFLITLSILSLVHAGISIILIAKLVKKSS